MPATKKKRARKVLKKQKTVIVFKQEINPKDTLFPEKVAKAKEIFSNAEFLDPRFGAGIRKD